MNKKCSKSNSVGYKKNQIDQIPDALLRFYQRSIQRLNYSPLLQLHFPRLKKSLSAETEIIGEKSDQQFCVCMGENVVGSKAHTLYIFQLFCIFVCVLTAIFFKCWSDGLHFNSLWISTANVCDLTSPHHTFCLPLDNTKNVKENKTESSLSPIRTKATRILLYFFGWFLYTNTGC